MSKKKKKRNDKSSMIFLKPKPRQNIYDITGVSSSPDVKPLVYAT